MSLDIVDDLHAAEDRIGALEAAINAVVVAWAVDAPVSALINAAQGVTVDLYCRPSCHGKFIPGPPIADERGTLWDDEACDDDCGCPCGHNGEEPQ